MGVVGMFDMDDRRKRSGDPTATDGQRALIRAARRHAERLLLLGRVVLVVEALVRILWPVAALATGYAALALFGILAALPSPIVWLSFHAILAFALWRLWRGRQLLRLPAREQAARRVERAAGLAHRPIMTLFDRPAGSGFDPALWRAHLLRAARDVLHAPARRVRPRFALAGADPHGLRQLVVLLLFAGLWLAGSHAGELLGPVVPPEWRREPARVALEAMLVPPAYTGQPARALHTGPLAGTLDTRLADLPEGTRLVLRLVGGHAAPRLRLPDGRRLRLDRQAASVFTAQTSLVQDGTLLLDQGRRRRFEIALELRRDMAPEIALAAPPKGNDQGILEISVRGRDDYGIVSAAVRLFEKGRKDAPFATLPLRFSGEGGRDETIRHFLDLAADIHAGEEVDADLVAEDAAGHRTQGRRFALKLPERRFHHPVARAIARLRLSLLRHHEQAPIIAAGLDALARRPGDFDHRLDVYSALRAAVWRLRFMHRPRETIGSAAALLWETALALEDDGLSLAMKDLRDAFEAMDSALAGEGDPAKAAAALEKALAGFMQGLAMRQLRETAQVPLADLAGLLDTQGAMDARDVRGIAEEIAAMMRAGRKDEARALLAKLRRMMEQAAAHPLNAEDLQRMAAAARAGRSLNRLKRAQEDLRDRTARGALLQGLLKDAGTSLDFTPAAGEQKSLEERLTKILEALKTAKLPPPPGLAVARKAMGDARRTLESRAPASAIVHQGEAIEGLARAIEDLRGRQGSGLSLSGAVMPPMNDPMGRRVPGLGVKDLALPKNGARAVEQLVNEVRRRLSDPNLGEEERAYLKSLLTPY
ncbi:MAG: DUF4175 family protein [Alphaproteobacteria bacterium]|nr:MAG: DUF4175 family protein [Alphaproteobacteria bacterium]